MLWQPFLFSLFLLPGCRPHNQTALHHDVATVETQNEIVAIIELDPFNSRDFKSCPKNAYLIGVSEDMAGMCVYDGQPLLSIDETMQESILVYHNQSINLSPRYGSEYDWAVKRMKLECPQGFFAAGLANNSETDSLGNRWPHLGLWCRKASARLTEFKGKAECKSVWFDRKTDTRPIDGSSRDLDFDFGSTKGQCERGQYVAGVAYWDSLLPPRNKPQTLLCCPWHIASTHSP